MSLIDCPECATAVSSLAPHCPHCGYPVKEPPIPMQSDEMGVVVTDFDMSFGNLVGFLVKIVIAAIPAMIILFIIGSGVIALLAGWLHHTPGM